MVRGVLVEFRDAGTIGEYYKESQVSNDLNPVLEVSSLLRGWTVLAKSS